MPSMSIAELRIDVEQGVPPTGFRVPRGYRCSTRVRSTACPCKFRTCYDTTLWPFTVTGVQWLTPDRLKPALRLGDAIAALRIELRCLPGVTFSQLELQNAAALPQWRKQSRLPAVRAAVDSTAATDHSRDRRREAQDR